MVKDAKVRVLGIALTVMGCTTTVNHHYPAPVGDGGSSDSSKVEYTCETGAQMFVDECCSIEDVCKESDEVMYTGIFSDCVEIKPHEYSNPLDFFPCAKNVCLNSSLSGKEKRVNINSCADQYLD